MHILMHTARPSYHSSPYPHLQSIREPLDSSPTRGLAIVRVVLLAPSALSGELASAQCYTDNAGGTIGAEGRGRVWSRGLTAQSAV